MYIIICNIETLLNNGFKLLPMENEILYKTTNNQIRTETDWYLIECLRVVRLDKLLLLPTGI